MRQQATQAFPIGSELSEVEQKVVVRTGTGTTSWLSMKCEEPPHGCTAALANRLQSPRQDAKGRTGRGRVGSGRGNS